MTTGPLLIIIVWYIGTQREYWNLHHPRWEGGQVCIVSCANIKRSVFFRFSFYIFFIKSITSIIFMCWMLSSSVGLLLRRMMVASTVSVWRWSRITGTDMPGSSDLNCALMSATTLSITTKWLRLSTSPVSSLYFCVQSFPYRPNVILLISP